MKNVNVSGYLLRTAGRGLRILLYIVMLKRSINSSCLSRTEGSGLGGTMTYVDNEKEGGGKYHSERFI